MSSIKAGARRPPVQFRDSVLEMQLEFRKSVEFPSLGAVAARDLKRYYDLLAQVRIDFEVGELALLESMLESDVLSKPSSAPQTLLDRLAALTLLERLALRDLLEQGV